MKNGLLFILVLAVFSGPVFADGTRSQFKVTYVSADHVYVDGGTEDGLNVGDTLALVTRDSVAAEIIYAAGHSASCRPLIEGVAIRVGDRMTVTGRAASRVAVEIPPVPENKNTAVIDAPQQPIIMPAAETPPPVINGGLTLGFYYWSDRSPANLDFNQSNARFSLKISRLRNEHLTLRIRTRGRYDVRQNAYAGTSRFAWENRLWEFSLTYDNPDGHIYVAAGRLLPRRLPSIGYLDGVQLELQPISSLRVGLLGGRRPDWLYRTENFPITRSGAYLTWINGNNRYVKIEQNFAAVGEFHGGEVSRTYLAAIGRIVAGPKWSLHYTTELDINTSWRADRTGSNVALSRAYAALQYQVSGDIRASVGYDNLRRYWTYEYYSLADSLFDDRVRQGWRGRVDWRINRTLRMAIGSGYRTRAGANGTWTYNASVRQSSIFFNYLAVYAYIAGFDGIYEHGLRYSAQLQLQYAPVGLLHLGFGAYHYAVADVDEKSKNNYGEFGINRDLARHYFVSGLMQIHNGDDIHGLRLETELGYRF